MKKLTKDEYKELLNQIGTITKFYMAEIKNLEFDESFNQTFDSINQTKRVDVDDKSYIPFGAYRYIERDNETLIFIREDEDNYRDDFIYRLSAGHNKYIKIRMNYSQFEGNNEDEMSFEILENYNRNETGHIYHGGLWIEESESGYKGKIYTENKKCILESGHYVYNHTTVVNPEDIYDENPCPPRFEDLSTTIKVSFDMPENISNPAEYALAETKKEQTKGIQRTR